MALIPGTLPSDTCYGTPQDLLELFAQYLDVPAFALNSKVIFSTSNPGATAADAIWFDTTAATNPIMKIFVSGGFVDYVANYIKNVSTNLTTKTVVGAGDFILISDVSASGDAKKTTAQAIANLNPPRILQVVSTIKTDLFSTSSTSFVDITGLSVSITPASASSKILIIANVNGSVNTADVRTAVRLLRGSTPIAIGDAAGSRARGFGALGNTIYSLSNASVTFLDTPSSAVALTYKIQLLVQTGYSAVVNSTSNDVDAASTPRTVSSITVMEVT
jgi:hypothetical protein